MSFNNLNITKHHKYYIIVSQKMKKLSNIEESIWSDMEERGAGEVTKKEDGEKVHTCIGEDVYLMDPKCDYDGLIKALFNKQYTYKVEISKLEHQPLTPERRISIKNNEDPYIFILGPGGRGTNKIAKFWGYDEITEFELDPDFINKYEEKDYMNICTCIGKKLQEFGDYIEFTSSKAEIYGIEHHDDVYGSTYNWKIVAGPDFKEWQLRNTNPSSDPDMAARKIIDLFIEAIRKEFKELEDEDIIINKGGIGYNIYVPFISLTDSISNIVNLQKYIDFSKNWFKV